MAETQRALGYQYNLRICTDDHLRSLEAHCTEQVEQSRKFLAAVQEELAARIQDALNDVTYIDGS
jgi:hypothetical protein